MGVDHCVFSMLLNPLKILGMSIKTKISTKCECIILPTRRMYVSIGYRGDEISPSVASRLLGKLISCKTPCLPEGTHLEPNNFSIVDSFSYSKKKKIRYS